MTVFDPPPGTLIVIVDRSHCIGSLSATLNGFAILSAASCCTRFIIAKASPQIWHASADMSHFDSHPVQVFSLLFTVQVFSLLFRLALRSRIDTSLGKSSPHIWQVDSEASAFAWQLEQVLSLKTHPSERERSTKLLDLSRGNFGRWLLGGVVVKFWGDERACQTEKLAKAGQETGIRCAPGVAARCARA